MAVPCPTCSCREARVVKGELRDDNVYRRRLECRRCGHRYTTFESLGLDATALISEPGGEHEELDQRLEDAGAPRR